MSLLGSLIALKQNNMKIKKIYSWLIKDSLGLNKKWWHRFLKVIFIVSLISLAIATIVSLVNSYPSIVNEWNYSSTITGKLNSSDYSGKIVQINQLYGEEEIISDNDIYANDYFPNLNDKELLLPYSSPIFSTDMESFCSNKLDKQIKEIAEENDINLFSTINPTVKTLSPNIEAFILYLNTNDIRCAMVDSYTMENDDGTTYKYTFLRPVDTSEYSIYKYKNNFTGFLSTIFLGLIVFFVYFFVVIFVYNKIILYIIYGNKK